MDYNKKSQNNGEEYASELVDLALDFTEAVKRKENEKITNTLAGFQVILLKIALPSLYIASVHKKTSLDVEIQGYLNIERKILKNMFENLQKHDMEILKHFGKEGKR